MEDFRIEKIGDGAYIIFDKDDTSFYLLEGDEKAALIDTGISPGLKILPMLKKLTSKEIILIITHAHEDHLYHMDEFETVYMCHDDLKMLELPIDLVTGGKNLDLTKTINIDDGDIIDIGNNHLEICKVPGHTYGSIVCLDRERKMLFTGDAIGSGIGVWLELPGVTSLEEYHDGLVHLQKWLDEKGDNITFFGGHHHQQYQSTLIKGFNPLDREMLDDMEKLVKKIIAKEIIGTPHSDQSPYVNEIGLYAYFGRAEIKYLPSKIYRERN